MIERRRRINIKNIVLTEKKKKRVRPFSPPNAVATVEFAGPRPVRRPVEFYN